MIAGKGDLVGAAGGGGSCKGMAYGCDIVDDNMGITAKECAEKSLKRKARRTRGDREISCLKL